MATTVSHTGSWVTDSFGGQIRLKSTLSRSSVNVTNNTSVVRYRVWVETSAQNFFNNVEATHNKWIDGTKVLDAVKIRRTAGKGETVLVMDNSRTVTHNSSGNKSVAASANWSSAYHPQVTTSLTLALDRIDKYPNAPGSAPTLSSSGLTVTVVSATAGANGGTISGYQARWRPAGGSWTTITLNTSNRTGTFTAPGGTVEVQTRAQTGRGWGSYSATRSLIVGTAPGTISSVTMSRGSREVTGSWSAPSNGGLTITKYETSIHNGRSWSAVRSTGTTLSSRYTNLLPGTGYRIRARAVNAIGPGSWRESAVLIPNGCLCA